MLLLRLIHGTERRLIHGLSSSLSHGGIFLRATELTACYTAAAHSVLTGLLRCLSLLQPGLLHAHHAVVNVALTARCVLHGLLLELIGRVKVLAHLTLQPALITAELACALLGNLVHSRLLAHGAHGALYAVCAVLHCRSSAGLHGRVRAHAERCRAVSADRRLS